MTVRLMMALAGIALACLAGRASAADYYQRQYGIRIPLPKGVTACRLTEPPGPDHGTRLWLADVDCRIDYLKTEKTTDYVTIYVSYNVDFLRTLAEVADSSCKPGRHRKTDVRFGSLAMRECEMRQVEGGRVEIDWVAFRPGSGSGSGEHIIATMGSSPETLSAARRRAKAMLAKAKLLPPQ